MAAIEAGGAGGRKPPKRASKEDVPSRAAPTPLAAASRRGAGGDPPPPCVHGGGGPPAGRSQNAPDSAPWGGFAGAETDGGVPPRPALAGVPAAGRRRGGAALGGSIGRRCGGRSPPGGPRCSAPPAEYRRDPPPLRAWPSAPYPPPPGRDPRFGRPSGATGGPLGPSRPGTAAGLAPARVQVPRKRRAPFSRPGVRGVPLRNNLLSPA